MRDESAAVILLAQCDPLHAFSSRPRNTVMSREPAIDQRERGIHQVSHAKITLQQLAEKTTRLLQHRVLQNLIKIRIQLRIRHREIDFGEVQPLIREALNEGS